MHLAFKSVSEGVELGLNQQSIQQVFVEHLHPDSARARGTHSEQNRQQSMLSWS